MADYSKQQALASKLIGKYGIPVKLTRKGVYDFNSGDEGVDFSWTGVGILTGALSSAATRSMASFSDGSLVTSESKALSMVVDEHIDATDPKFFPKQGDIAVVLGIEWKVSAVDTTEPGGVPIVHTVVLGRA